MIYKHIIQDYEHGAATDVSPQIAYCMFVTMWNACLQPTKVATPRRKIVDSQKSDHFTPKRSSDSDLLELDSPVDCLRFRVLALKFLAMSDKPGDLFIDKSQTRLVFIANFIYAP